MKNEQIEALQHDDVNGPRFLEALNAYEILDRASVGDEATDEIIEQAGRAYEALCVRFGDNSVGVMALSKEIGACRVFGLFGAQIEAVLIDGLEPTSGLLLGFNLAHLLDCSKCQGALRAAYVFDKNLLAVVAAAETLK